jgi:hypothetical protein
MLALLERVRSYERDLSPPNFEYADTLMTEDVKGPASFNEKRRPIWSGC